MLTGSEVGRAAQGLRGGRLQLPAAAFKDFYRSSMAALHRDAQISGRANARKSGGLLR